MSMDLTPQIAAVDLRNDDYLLAYRTDGDIVVEDRVGDKTSPRSGTAAVAVIFDIDDSIDYVYADLYQQGDVETLERAIETLAKIRDQIVNMYGDQPRHVGRCYAIGFGGQCDLPSGHEPDPHEFPLSDDAAAMMTPARAHEARTRPMAGSWQR